MRRKLPQAEPLTQGKAACLASAPADNWQMAISRNDTKSGNSDSRGRRLAVALRENLRRRKAQLRARATSARCAPRENAPKGDKGG
jgi:hypothetical protein